VLVLKSRQEYQETMNGWKQTDHIMGIMLENREQPQKTFLQKFYEGTSGLEHCLRRPVFIGEYKYTGRDEDAVVPAATGVQ
jgi:NADH dehydrogenase (ubiquinone) 1 alpha subcomplex subunit 6